MSDERETTWLAGPTHRAELRERAYVAGQAGSSVTVEPLTLLLLLDMADRLSDIHARTEHMIRAVAADDLPCGGDNGTLCGGPGPDDCWNHTAVNGRCYRLPSLPAVPSGSDEP